MGNKDISTLVSDIEKLFDGKDLSERISHLTDKLGTAFVERFLDYSEERKPTLRMSNLGKPLRQLYYELNDYKKEPLSPQTKMKFLYGSICEELVLFLVKEAGYSVTKEQMEVEVDGVKGHIDAFIEDVLVDVKSCSTRSFEKFEKGKLLEDDPFGYIAQLNGYAVTTGATRAAFLAIDKVLGKICLLEIKLGEYDVPKRISEVRTAVASDIPPERCYKPKPLSKTDKSGNLVLASGCGYCSHKFECWKDANDGQGLLTRFYSTGPKFFTTLLKEPKLRNDYNKETFDVFPTRED